MSASTLSPWSSVDDNTTIKRVNQLKRLIFNRSIENDDRVALTKTWTWSVRHHKYQLMFDSIEGLAGCAPCSTGIPTGILLMTAVYFGMARCIDRRATHTDTHTYTHKSVLCRAGLSFYFSFVFVFVFVFFCFCFFVHLVVVCNSWRCIGAGEMFQH